jgi:hypothetical protein
MKSIAAVAVLVAALIVAIIPAQASGEEIDPAKMKWGEYQGPVESLLPDSIPMQGKPSGTPGEWASSSYTMKDRKGLNRLVTVTIGKYVRKTASARCGSMYTPSSCAFHILEENTVEYYFDREYILTSPMTVHRRSNVAATEFLGTNVLKEETSLNIGKNGNRQVGTPKPKVTYHYATWRKWDGPHQAYDLFHEFQLGNLHVRVHMRDCDGSFDNLAKQFEREIVAKLLGKPTAPPEEERKETVVAEPAKPKEEERATPTDIEVYPSIFGSIGDTGLIPATNGLPALIVAKKAKPGTDVEFIVDTPNAELRAGAKKGKRVVVKADRTGKAEAKFFYTGSEPLKTSAEHQVTVYASGRKSVARVIVGLGLAFDTVKPAKGQTYKDNLYAFALTVKSTFHPRLNLPVYLMEAEKSGVWGGYTVGVRLMPQWLNNPGDGPGDTAYDGTTKISAVGSGNALTATRFEPYYFQTNYKYPAVILNSEGRHVYGMGGKFVVMDAQGNVARNVVYAEPFTGNKATMVLTLDRPEHWFQSAACAMEAQGYFQYVMLESLKKVPAYGGYVDAFTTATSLVCGFVKGEYEKTFYDLGTVLGGKYLDHILEPEVFEKLTSKQQKAAKLAKEAYDRLGEHKSEKDKDEALQKTIAEWKAKGWLKDDDLREQAPQESASTTTGSSQSGNDNQNIGKAVNDGLRDVGKALKDAGQTLKNLFGK